MATWKSRIRDLQASGLTFEQIGEAVGLAGTTVSDLANGWSKSPRGDAALAMHLLHVERCGNAAKKSKSAWTSMRRTITRTDEGQGPVQQIARRRRLPLNRLLEARELNTLGSTFRDHFKAGFGDLAPPDRRRRCAVVQFERRLPWKKNIFD
jgi:hypothetical protein